MNEKSFKEYYLSELNKSIERLNKQRKINSIWTLILGLFAIVYLIVGLSLLNNRDWSGIIWILMAAICIACIAAMLKALRLLDLFRKKV